MTPALGLGQPHRSPHPRARPLALRPWGDGALHPALGLLAQHSRVDPAHIGPPCILGRRALEGQHPQSTDQLITGLEAIARSWNADPTPFVWGGKRAARAARRARARERRQARAGSGACIRRPLRRTRYGYGRRN